MQKENNCKASTSITTRSNKDVYTECKNQRIVKSICYLEMKKKKPKKMYHKIKKYKHHINKLGKNKYCKKILNKENTNKFSKIAMLRSKKNDIKINKNIAKHKNFLNTKKLTIALTKIDDLPLSELCKIIPDYVASKLKKQDNKGIYYETKDIIKTQCCSYKQYRTTELKQNEEINVLYHKSVFEKKCTEFKENVIEGIDTNITNIKFERNTYKMYNLQNEINNIEILQDNEHKLENINLLENILKFFLKTKDNMINRRTRHKLKIQKLHEHGIIKSLAICNKCKEIINLLQQFSNKINFINDEKLCIECTLCNLQINSLSHFQEHLMNIHLKCEKDILLKKDKFPVIIINFNKQLNLNNNNQFIFECCCCSKIFDHMNSFEEHIKKYHDFNYCIKKNKKRNQIVKNFESCTTFQNEAKFKKNHNLNKNHIFDITTKAVEISNLEEKIDTQHNHINEFCINTKEINFKNNIYYNSNNNKNLLSKIKIKEKQINDTQIMQKIPKINIKKLNIDEKYSNNITIISESNSKSLQNQNSNFFNDCFNQKYKDRKYKKTHMSTHVNNSHVDMYREKQKIQESKNAIKYENDLILQNVNSKNSKDHTKTFKNNNIINSIINLEKPNQNISISEIIDKKINVKNENMEYVIKKDNIMNENDDCNYILNINLTQKTKEGIKKQKLIKFSMNITKKYTTNTTNKDKFIENIMEDKFPINFNRNSNFAINLSKNNDSYNLTKLYCNICDKKFSSVTTLREHMFLHDSLFENSQFTNSLMIPYFNNPHKIKNLSRKNTYISRKENKVLLKIKILKKILQKRNKIHEKTTYQIPNKNINKKNRKWRCSPCKENFALLRNYLRHKYYCHNDESVIHICDNCNKILTSVAMVNIHICTNVTSWNCKRCNLNFPNAISLTQHNMNTHLETIGPHKCKICKSSFLTSHMLIKHETIHSMNNDSSNNLGNFIDFSASVKNSLSHTVHNVNINTEFSEKESQSLDNKDIFAIHNDTFLQQLDKLNGKLSKLNITSNILYNNEKVLHCKNCNISCVTTLQMKLHLKKWHKWNKCEICNNLYLTYELTKHLIFHHIVFDLCYKKNNINIQSTHENINFQNDIIEILGMKRLVSLYEYERFSNIKNKYFNCIICSKQFSNIEYYKIHYLKYHDTICLLCNIEFNYNFEAFEHKIKIHKNVDLYLWVVQILLLAILQLNKYGKTIEEVILKCSESRIY